MGDELLLWELWLSIWDLGLRGLPVPETDRILERVLVIVAGPRHMGNAHPHEAHSAKIDSPKIQGSWVLLRVEAVE